MISSFPKIFADLIVLEILQLIELWNTVSIYFYNFRTKKDILCLCSTIKESTF